MTVRALVAITLALAGPAAALPTALVRPLGRPDALVDLRTADGVRLVKGQWRYSDAQIVEVDGKTTAPDEIRGAAIAGGDTRRLAKGDVVIVPNGTPHWFKEVDGPVLYYVVKVR